MRRVVNELRAYAADLAGTTARAWGAFFFRPADPTPLGLIRVVAGLLLLWSMGVYGIDLQAYLGSGGWADPEIVRLAQAEQGPGAWSFWLLVPDPLLRPVWILCLVVLACFTLGIFSRVAAVLTWIIVVSTARRAPVALFGFDQIVSSWVLYLAATGASGQAFSLDRFLVRYRLARASVARRRQDGRWVFPPGFPAPTVSANLGLRLIQLHLALIYGMAGLAKLQGQGWWSGMAIWGVLASAEFREVDLTWLVAYPWILNLMTHVSLALEVGYPVLIWVRVLRPLVLAAVVVLHLGIALAAPGLTVFGIAMIAGNLAFLSGPWLRSFVTGRVQPAGRVLYDGACPRCRATMAMIAAMDPDRVIDPIDLTAVDVATIHPSLTREACMESMHYVGSDGRVVAGYDAVVAISRRLPPAWPFGLIGSLPILSHAGHRVYNAIAASRPRDVPCTDDVCGIHHRPTAADPKRASR